MNDYIKQSEFESADANLDKAIQALLAEPVPEDAVERVMVRAQQLASTTSQIVPQRQELPQSNWLPSRATLILMAMAAAILVTLIGIPFLFDSSAGHVFAQVIEKVKAAKTVRLVMSTRLGQRPEVDGQMFLEGHRMRLEQFEGKLIQIADFQRKQALFLNQPGKLAQQVALDERLVTQFANPIEQLERAKLKDAESIGQEILRGRRTNVYRLGKIDFFGIKGSGEMLVWVDVESGLPSKIVIRDTDPKAESEFRFDQLVWNEPIEARLFALDVPEGFRSGIVVTGPDAGKANSTGTTTPQPVPDITNGVLRDRVPAQILWNRSGTMITVLMRDAEGIPASEYRPNALSQWDLATGKLKWSQTIGGASHVAGSADGKTLATVMGREIQLRDATTGQITRKWTTQEPLSPLAFSPDGKTLAAGITQWGRYGGNGGKESGGVQLWDIDRASLVLTIPDDKPVTFLAVSVDGKSVATSSNAGPVKLWDMATGKLIRVFPGSFPMDFSPDGKTIACQASARESDKTVSKIEIVTLADGVAMSSLVSDKGASPSTLLRCSFSPDGKLLAGSDWNGTVSIWDVATGRRLPSSGQFKAGVLSIAFSPDGTTLAIGSEDKTLRLLKISADVKQEVPEKK